MCATSICKNDKTAIAIKSCIVAFLLFGKLLKQERANKFAAPVPLNEAIVLSNNTVPITVTYY